MSGQLIVELRAVPRSERMRTLGRFVAAEVRQLLQMTPDEHLPTDRSYFDLGLTSLGAIELKERLEGSLGCVIDAEVLFNHPTVADLVRHLAEDALRDLFTASPTRPGGAREGGR